MKKYLVYYHPQSRNGKVNHDELEKCWVYASNEVDAEWRAEDENWDVGEVVHMRRIG